MFNTEIAQSCLARSHSTKVWGMVLRELNNSLIFSLFSPVASNISRSFEKCLLFISLSPSHFKFSMRLISALSFCDRVKYIYPRCHPTSMFFAVTREVVHVVHTTRCTRSVTHTQTLIDTTHDVHITPYLL